MKILFAQDEKKTSEFKINSTFYDFKHGGNTTTLEVIEI